MCCQIFKCVFIIINILFLLVGSIILGVGIWLKVAPSTIFEFLSSLKLNSTASSFSNTSTSVLDIVAIAMIVMGAYTLLAGIAGCVGACKSVKCLLYLYAILVVVVIIAEIGIGIYAGVKTSEFQKFLENSIKNLIKSDFNGLINPNSNAFTKTFSAVMIELKCCGASGFDDFSFISKPWKQSWDSVKQVNPIGCCSFKDNFNIKVEENYNEEILKKQITNSTCPTDKDAATLATKGCVESMMSLIQKNLTIVIGVCIGLGLLEIICVFVAIYFARKLDNSQV